MSGSPAAAAMASHGRAAFRAIFGGCWRRSSRSRAEDLLHMAGACRCCGCEPGGLVCEPEVPCTHWNQSNTISYHEG
jgi:hypothetical protein